MMILMMWAGMVSRQKDPDSVRKGGFWKAGIWGFGSTNWRGYLKVEVLGHFQHWEGPFLSGGSWSNFNVFINPCYW